MIAVGLSTATTQACSGIEEAAIRALGQVRAVRIAQRHLRPDAVAVVALGAPPMCDQLHDAQTQTTEGPLVGERHRLLAFCVGQATAGPALSLPTMR